MGLMHFLKYGNKLFIMSLFLWPCSCHNDTEYIIKADFRYVYGSAHTVEISGPPFVWEYLQNIGKEHLVLSSNDSVSIHIDTDGSKINGPDDYSGFLNIHPIVLRYDGSLNDTLEINSNRGIIGIKNYDFIEIQSNYYSFIYHFTDKDFESAK